MEQKFVYDLIGGTFSVRYPKVSFDTITKPYQVKYNFYIHRNQFKQNLILKIK